MLMQILLFHASTDDQIDIKVAGTDVGNFNSNTLKLVKDGTPVLEVEDTAETAYSGVLVDCT